MMKNINFEDILYIILTITMIVLLYIIMAVIWEFNPTSILHFNAKLAVSFVIIWLLAGALLKIITDDD